MPSSLLELKGVRKDFRKGKNIVHALFPTDLEIMEGEILGLVGESGSGKSTLANIIVRLIPSDSGSIVFDGIKISGLGERAFKRYRRDIQMVFQDPYSSINPKKKIGYLLDECLRIHEKGMSREERERKVYESLDEVGLDISYAERYQESLSGGQRQRVAIALALILRPRLIVLDEPVSALDVSIEAQILNLLLDLRNRHNLTYLFISHDLNVVSYLSDRIAVMYKGSVVELAKAEELMSCIMHPYTEALFRASEDLEADKKEENVVSHGCPFASRCSKRKAICLDEKPLLMKVNDSHSVACWRAFDENSCNF